MISQTYLQIFQLHSHKNHNDFPMKGNKFFEVM